jgi:hypothetical protein
MDVNPRLSKWSEVKPLWSVELIRKTWFITCKPRVSKSPKSVDTYKYNEDLGMLDVVGSG